MPIKFCPYLFHDINLEPASVQPCCDVHGVEVPRFPFAGGRLDMAAYVVHIGKMMERLQARDDKLCRGCPELRETAGDALGHVPVLFHTVSINAHRYLCNCKCVYCDLWRGKQAGYPVLPVLQSLHQQHALHSQCSFSWGGGEPSIQRDFEEASTWICKHGWEQYIHTNCLRFSPSIANLLQLGRGVIDVSLDSGSAAIYQKVKGVPGFDRVCENLERYMATAVDASHVRLKYIVFDENNAPSEINSFFAICGRLGVTTVEYSLNFRELNGAGPSNATLLGAAFFQTRAKQLGLKCNPFFIPPKWQDAINDMSRKHLSGDSQEG